MSPVHVGPVAPCRVALPEEVVLAVVVEHPVRVVVPASHLAHVKLGPERFVVERLEVADFVAGFEHFADFRCGFGDDLRGLANVFGHVEVGPPVDGILVRWEVAVEIVDELVADDDRHPAALSLVRNGEDDVFARDFDLLGVLHMRSSTAAPWRRDEGFLLRLRVALRDLIDVDVAPAAGRGVDDLEDGFPALVLSDVPVFPVEELAAACLGVDARGGEDDFAANEKVHAGLALMSAAADEELDVVPLDGELRRGEPARRLVAAEERVDESLAFKTGNPHLAAERALRRRLAERRAFDFPALPVRLPLEIGDENVAPLGRDRRSGQGERQAQQQARNQREGGAVHGGFLSLNPNKRRVPSSGIPRISACPRPSWGIGRQYPFTSGDCQRLPWWPEVGPPENPLRP